MSRCVQKDVQSSKSIFPAPGLREQGGLGGAVSLLPAILDPWPTPDNGNDNGIHKGSLRTQEQRTPEEDGPPGSA